MAEIAIENLGRRRVYGTAAPTTGTWVAGDTTLNTAPTATGLLGWFCSTAGTPGTWTAFYAGGPSTVGTGSPEGVITAAVGATYHRTDGGASTSFYVKESGAGNTGWVGK